MSKPRKPPRKFFSPPAGARAAQVRTARTRKTQDDIVGAVLQLPGEECAAIAARVLDSLQTEEVMAHFISNLGDEWLEALADAVAGCADPDTTFTLSH